MAEVVVSAMVEGVVSFGMEKLWDLLSRESERLQGVHEHVDDLERQMRKLQSLLKDADAKKHKNEVVRNFLEDVKDIVYDAEDIIESFLLKESSGNEKGIKRRVKGLSCFLVERRDISIDIEGITKRMSEVVAEMQSFGIKEIMYDGRSLSLKERQRVQREIRQTFPKSSEKGLVGVEESVEELVGHLAENDNIQVVSISGMGGIGKTTLARQVFHHDIVRRRFHGFAWVCVSKEFQRKDIWQKILKDLRTIDEDVKQMDENELQAKLFLLLGTRTRRHLIVIDDVWKNEDWDLIKDVFPEERGWKVILTSRDEGVGLHADPTCFAFTPKILTPEESWKLCEGIALSRRDKTEFSVDKELEDMGKKIVTYCGGLPLAVKVMGGLLAKKKTVDEWKRVYKNIQTQIFRLDDNKQDSVYRVLSLSYEDLPMELKHCFLCLAYFPEDYKIQVNKLCYFWAAEGIITSSCDGPTIRESGEEYMEELIRRNMVIAEKDSLSWRWESCQMHDMMREVCLYEAKKENFLQLIKAPTTSTSTVNAHTRRSRRLVVHGGNALNMRGGKSNKKARSVLGFGLDRNLWKQSSQVFRKLQLLRVLDLGIQLHAGYDLKRGRIPSNIGKLIHLRYLSLNVTSVSHLPSSLRNLKLLLYLSLVSMNSVHVPNIFKEMVQLRYLALPPFMDDKTRLELDNLVNLEFLVGFRSKNGSITDFLRMTRLRNLKVILKGMRSVMAEVVVSAMVEGVVAFGVEKLWDLLSRESERLQGVHEHVSDLERQIRKLQSLLKDADAKKHENEVVRNFLEDVKDIVYDAEDIIESFLLKESSGDKKGIKRFSRFLVNRRDISIDIEGIAKRMSEVVADMQSFGIKEIMNDGRSLSLKERQRIRQTFPKSSEKGLVGVEESVEELVGHLVENDNIQVFSISGMGGIGKTTLARQVFHHDIVRRHFDGFAWVCVSKEFRRKDIWQKILQDLKPHVQAIKQMDENELQEKLFPLLGARRHLIVLDDVWKNEDWDRIKDEMQSAGWKMILTSRNEGVGLHADPTRFAFTPKILTPEESWKICERIALSRRDKTEFSVDKELEAMGKKMVNYCRGLPLAVKVLGGLLAEKYTVEEWKRVYDNIQTRIIRSNYKNQDSIYRVLSLSYEDLPVQLKHCFLCLAYFPEDYTIQVDTLYYLWAAEGIITLNCDGPTIEESGEEYLEELIKRNMVIAEKSIRSWGWDYCQMHDMMREVCLSKAKEENFLQVIKAPTSTSTVNVHTRESRRLVVHGGNALNLLGRKSNKKARSVLGFGLDRNLWKQSAQGFRNLQLLRVLDLSLQLHGGYELKGGRVPSNIGKLIHLRYLSLNVTSGSHLPSSLRNLKLLLYFTLSSSGNVYVPNIFKEMVELRYLVLPPLMDDKTKLELGNLVNLELLWCFQSKSGSFTDLRGMTRLRTLYLVFKGRYTSEILASSLRELRNLEKLRLISLSESDVAPDVDFIWNFIHLRDLGMSMLMPRLPELSRFPLNLASISLANCRMEEDPIPILEKLLHLQSVELGFSAFVGRKMVCSKGGFPQLHKLNLMVLKELEEWEIEEGSMPCLSTLSIGFCDKLKEIPEGLKYIISLKELKISGMNKEWNEKLESGGESYYKVQHIPSVQFNHRRFY
ncbi:unnamed protein product [Brassica oleracea]